LKRIDNQAIPSPDICSLNNKVNLDMDYTICIYHLITIREDLDAITSILYQAFEIPPFKRDYDTAFGKIADILARYRIIENPRNLRFRFTLCMQEFFDSIPQDQWKIKDPVFIKQSEVFAITKFKEWIIEQIT
jgi:hypothetical protein